VANLPSPPRVRSSAGPVAARILCQAGGQALRATIMPSPELWKRRRTAFAEFLSAPPLEQAFLPGEEEIELAARRLVGY